MTCKELVLFIINHDLLDVPINDFNFKDILMTVDEAAVKMGISTTSLEDMIKLGLVDYIELQGKKYLHHDVTLTSIKRR